VSEVVSGKNGGGDASDSTLLDNTGFVTTSELGIEGCLWVEEDNDEGVVM
jgi:hypothetical protein